MDFKCGWKLGHRERCEPLTVRDAYSRFVLAAQLLDNAPAEMVGTEFTRLFQLYGLPKDDQIR